MEQGKFRGTKLRQLGDTSIITGLERMYRGKDEMGENSKIIRGCGKMDEDKDG